jgi:hypothetical protein
VLDKKMKVINEKVTSSKAVISLIEETTLSRKTDKYTCYRFKFTSPDGEETMMQFSLRNLDEAVDVHLRLQIMYNEGFAEMNLRR